MTQIILPLNRPQYVPSPEVLISALAGSVLRFEDSEFDSIGRRYLGPEKPNGAAKTIRTCPDDLPRLDESLKLAGLQHDVPHAQVAAAVVRSISGVRATHSKGQAASPMSPALALLQNPVGMTGSGQPPNFAGILETMFQLGSAQPSAGMAALWLRAAEARLDVDPVVRAIDRAFSSYYGPYVRRPDATPAVSPAASHFVLVNSPFGWLHDAWVKLTSDGWVRALPPRVWADWATTVLRLAMAMGFLWECQRYSRICHAVLTGAADPASAGVPPTGSPFELIPWPDSYLPVSSRNVSSILRKRTDDGGRLRALLTDQGPEGLGAKHDELTSPEAKDKIRRALASREQPRYLQNLYETVVYSLLRRDQGDHYGLLAPRGNAYRLVDPGTEWIAMIASLAAEGPGSETHVGRLVEELARLGLHPSLPELIGRLEAAGLARGSADADHGVRVASAY